MRLSVGIGGAPVRLSPQWSPPVMGGMTFTPANFGFDTY